MGDISSHTKNTDTAITTMGKKVKVGAVQAEPAWWDLEGSVNKVISLIETAGKDGVNVLGFPEVFVPGYPWSIWTVDSFSNGELIHKYMANSLKRVSPEMDRIREAVKKAGIFVVLGYSERAGASVYIAQSFIDPTGQIVLHRRKIKPTGVERAIWGDGQADSLVNVFDSPQFGKIGGLNCWEHLQPLLRYHEYSQGVEIHVASWPYFCEDAEGVPHHIKADTNRSATQFMALEGACFVLLATQILTNEHRETVKIGEFPGMKSPGGGFAMIFAPDGAPLVKPIPAGEEGILTADIDLSAIDYAKQMIDVVGHYSRPDLLSLNVNKEAAKHVHYI
ncbi:hypothetical protein H2200_006266 [Cladophialophora chaetospira]|uniref:nitrilase n=1 Tax=Cladophialophora chaetospira TaxID=386627 RepID=A0AA38XAL1_9EURO|nr:hypothetical protein H2200_006266 [Cladophialophora chaetospira]